MAYTFLIIVTTVIYLLLMELSKNVILGWATAVFLVGVLLYIRKQSINKKKWNTKKGAALYLALIVLFILNYWYSEPPVK